MLEGLANLENYINYRDGSDPLIRAALVHYQFETIKAAHQWGLLSEPVQCISKALLTRQDEHYASFTSNG